jgi:hypothetical protein
LAEKLGEGGSAIISLESKPLWIPSSPLPGASGSPRPVLGDCMLPSSCQTRSDWEDPSRKRTFPSLQLPNSTPPSGPSSSLHPWWCWPSQSAFGLRIPHGLKQNNSSPGTQFGEACIFFFNDTPTSHLSSSNCNSDSVFV